MKPLLSTLALSLIVIASTLGYAQADAESKKVKDVEELSASAKRHLVQREYDAAIADYSKAIKISPQDAQLYDGRGLAFEGKRDYKRAIADFSKAIQIDPSNTDFLSHRGFVYWGADVDPKEMAPWGIDNLSKAILIDPQKAQLYHSRALFFAFAGDNDRAIADDTKAIQIDPRNWTFYMERGHNFRSNKDYGSAKADYLKVLEIFPHNSDAECIGLGKVYLAEKEYAKAITGCSTSIQRSPSRYPYNYYTRALAYTEDKQYGLAIADYSTVIDIDPPNIWRLRYSAYTGRCGAFLALNKYEEAVADCTKAVELDPKRPEAYLSRAAAYVAVGRTQMAKSDQETANKLSKK